MTSSKPICPKTSTFINVLVEQAIMREAINKGREEGLEEGIRQGTLETAKKFKDLGVSIEAICNATGLTFGTS